MSDEDRAQRLRDEVASFDGLWEGGYYEGDPLDPMGPSSFGLFGYMSVLHATYLRCIKPYVRPDTKALEIGPGRGAWTRTMLQAQEVWCLDALSAEHNGFWRYVGEHQHVHYHHVLDFSASVLPEDHFDYFFSFGVFCHFSFDGVKEYLSNLHGKLRRGANAFVLVGDYEKYNRSLDQFDALGVQRSFDTFGQGKKARLRKLGLDAWWKVERRAQKPQWDKHRKVPSRDSGANLDKFHHSGVQQTCAFLEEVGYTVLDPDVGVLHRDPIIHFTK